ncbi:MAG: heme-dependent peroxidase [Candidatus Eremiobacteraeota bacterium]|nr:heme-dependent peroxidase [Candidatus Eremiobacteraeota bacterium]
MRHPDVPESLEGWWILHRMFAFDRRAFEALSAKKREKYTAEAADAFLSLENDDGDVGLVQLIGHKADFMLTHYARTFDDLATAQTLVDKLELFAYFVPRASFVSVLELGLYEVTAKIHTDLESRGLKPHSNEWNAAFDALLREQERNPRNAGRLWAKIPPRRYACFYPMDKKRGDTANWYMLPYEERARLMLEHGKIGRTFHGLVTQVISGSIGFDDYEWGVDLYADDPLVFKKLIYEMRFDEASARYALFGEFYSGVQFSLDQLGVYLDGSRLPALELARKNIGEG